MSENDRLIAGRYRLNERLGSGGMGVVWLARDERLDRAVAVKQLLLPPYLTGAQAEEAKLRAMRESRIAARIQHPNVIAIYDVVEDAGHPCLVMEYLPSRSLSEVLNERGTLPPDEVAQIGAQAARALASAHAAGVVHRDVKPGNVLMGERGIVKIADFGIARATGDVTVTMTGLISGSPAYLSPEVARGQDATFASDVFSLGSTLYAAVEGTPPFGRSENAIALLYRAAGGEITRPRQAGPLTGILLRLLNVRPEQRPAMAEVGRMLSAVAPVRAPIGEVLPSALPPQGRREGGGLPGAASVRGDDAVRGHGGADEDVARPETGWTSDAADESDPIDGADTADSADADAPARADASRSDDSEHAAQADDPVRSEEAARSEDSARTEDSAWTADLPARGEQASARADAPSSVADGDTPRTGAAAAPGDTGWSESAPTRYDQHAEPSADSTAMFEAPFWAPSGGAGDSDHRDGRDLFARPRRTKQVILLAAAAIVAVAVAGVALAMLLSPDDDPKGGTAVSSPSPTPTPSASRTRTPTTPPTKASSPSPPPSKPTLDKTSRTDPQPAAARRKAITSYYAVVPGNLGQGWTRLTPRYQNTAGGYASYQGWWGSIRQASASDVRPAGGNRISARVVYTFKSGRVVEERHTYTLVQRNGRWLIDASTVVSSTER